MFDVIIIGGGVAGLAASLFTAKAGLTTVVFDNDVSQALKVHAIHNYLGIPEISGAELLHRYREQVSAVGVQLRNETVVAWEHVKPYFRVTTEAQRYDCNYLVIATNLNTQPLTDFGFDVVVNQKVPSGKIRMVEGLGPEGQTHIPGLYIAGLLSGAASQAIIAAGQGASVGVDIATKAAGKSYMWHD